MPLFMRNSIALMRIGSSHAMRVAVPEFSSPRFHFFRADATEMPAAA